MKIKITALILLLSLVLSMLPATALESVDISGNFGLSEFLSMLSVGDSLKKDDDTVTRAEFISYVMDAMNVNLIVQNDGTFSDVPALHPYSEDIFKAKSLGVITGAGGNEFRPDDEIAYMEAVKICVMALGYMRVAEVKGGYPYGYLMVARDIDLTNGVPDTKKMRFADVSLLLRNFLLADICITNGVIGSEVSQYRSAGLNILKQYHGLEMISGIIKTAGYYSMVPEFKGSDYTINISGRVFDTAISNAERYLGFDVTAFYDPDKNEIKALYLNRGNSVLQLEADDIYGFGNFTISAESGEKEAKYKLDPGFSYVKNGRIIRAVETDFTLDNGTMTLIDNNADNLYDVVIVMESTYMVISGNSITSESIFDARTNKSIRFKNEGGNHYYLSMVDVNGNVSEIKPAALSGNTVLEVYESIDGNYVEAVASKKSVTGMIEEVSDDYVLIDNTRYKLNSYFKTHFKALPGETNTYLISANGTITAIGKAAATVNYGFLADFGVLENGLAKSIVAKVLDQGGSMKEFLLADKIKLDGELVSNKDASVKAKLANGDFAKYQVIKYTVGEDGRISMIDTALAASGTLEDKYKTKLHDGDDLTINHSSKSVYIYRGYNVLQPVSSVSTSTVVFTVPSCLAASNNTEGTDKRLARYDDKHYAVSSSISSALTSSGNYYVDIYDMNEGMEAGVVVMYTKNVEAKASLNGDMDPAVVYKVSDALSSEGELTKKITVWSRGEFNTYYFNTQFLSDLNSSQIPKSGDIVRLSTDNMGEIAGLDIDVKYNPVTGKPEVDTSVANKRDQMQWVYYSGKLFGMTPNSISLTVEQEPPFSQSFSGEFTGYADNMVPLMLNGSTFYAGYDTKTGTVYRMKNTDYKGASSVGSTEASYVITYGYAGWARLVVEYGAR